MHRKVKGHPKEGGVRDRIFLGVSFYVRAVHISSILLPYLPQPPKETGIPESYVRLEGKGKLDAPTRVSYLRPFGFGPQRSNHSTRKVESFLQGLREKSVTQTDIDVIQRGNNRDYHPQSGLINLSSGIFPLFQPGNPRVTLCGCLESPLDFRTHGYPSRRL